MSRKKKELVELREQPLAELKKQLAVREKELFDVRMSAYTDQERSPSHIRAIRREVARILTIMSEKQRAAAGAS